jgi:hypothetical protein
MGQGRSWACGGSGAHRLLGPQSVWPHGEGKAWLADMQRVRPGQALVAHAYNPNYLGGWDREVVRGQPRQIVHKTPVSKITRAKWTGGPSMKPWVQTLVPPKKWEGEREWEQVQSTHRHHPHSMHGAISSKTCDATLTPTECSTAHATPDTGGPGSPQTPQVRGRPTSLLLSQM